MKDLFTLNDDSETETSNIFSQISGEINLIGAHNDSNQDHKQKSRTEAAGKELEMPKTKGKEKADKREDEVDEETNILRSLFDAQGIHVSFLDLLLPLHALC